MVFSISFMSSARFLSYCLTQQITQNVNYKDNGHHKDYWNTDLGKNYILTSVLFNELHTVSMYLPNVFLCQ